MEITKYSIKQNANLESPINVVFSPSSAEINHRNEESIPKNINQYFKHSSRYTDAQCLNHHFAENFYINQLKLIEIQQKIIRGANLATLKEYIIKVYDMFSLYQKGFSQLNITVIFRQIQQILKFMGKASLMAIDYHYTIPVSNRKSNQFYNVKEQDKKKEKDSKERVSQHSQLIKIQNQGKNRKLKGIHLYKQNYNRHIEAHESHHKNIQLHKMNKFLTKEQARIMIDEDLMTQDEFRDMMEKEEMEFFIERRKILENMITNDNHQNYMSLQKQFYNIENDLKNFLSKYELDFQYTNINMLNFETSQTITDIIKESRHQQIKNQSLMPVFKALLKKMNSKIKQENTKYQQKQQERKRNKVHKGIQTNQRWSQIRQYKWKIKQLDLKAEKYEKLCEQLQSKELTMKTQQAHQSLQLALKQSQVQIQKLQNTIKILQQKIIYLCEINKSSGKDLISIFTQLSDQSKSHFMKLLGGHGYTRQRYSRKRFSAKIDKYRDRGSSILSKISRTSSLAQQAIINSHFISQSPKNIEEAASSPIEIKINNTTHKIFSQFGQNQPQLDTNQIIKKKAKKKNQFTHQSTNQIKEKNLMKPYPIRQKTLIKQKIQAKEQSMRIPSIQLLTENIQGEQEEMKETKKIGSNVRVTRYELNIQPKNEENEFRALKPGKVKKDKNKDKNQIKQLKTRKSLQNCFQIQSKSKQNLEAENQEIYRAKKNISIHQNNSKIYQQNSNGISKQNSSVDVKNSGKMSTTKPQFQKQKRRKSVRRIKSIINPQDLTNSQNKNSFLADKFSTKDQQNEIEKKIKNKKNIEHQSIKSDNSNHKQKDTIPKFSRKQEFLKFLTPVSEEEKIKKIARQVKDFKEFKIRIQNLHRIKCSNKICTHIQKFLLNFEKYRKSDIRKKSMKLSVHNMQEQIR